jgi:hypothetical protein
MKSPRLVLLVGVFVSLVAAGGVRADFNFIYNGHTYQFVQSNQTWINATTAAKAKGVAGSPGYLVEINDASENAEVFTRLLANVPPALFNSTRAPDGGTGAYVWLGATDRGVEGTWLLDGDGNGAGPQFWSGTKSGSAVGGLYNNWGRQAAQNEPDNFNNQDAAGISLDNWPLGSAGQWNDVAEGNALFYMVEFNAVPEPSLGIAAGAVMVTGLMRRRVAR